MICNGEIMIFGFVVWIIVWLIVVIFRLGFFFMKMLFKKFFSDSGKKFVWKFIDFIFVGDG